ncbi:lipopolysaccharide biosynthesis protein [Cohnella sp. JJ-181]|uniref:lipopolysaccharide biosynthesis protein n=1 Tax=Cohnella rhizoplanae TaxID=2974897 RepID=UPI00232EF5BF|nr:oligosaccharide flippase family protein [Cohnella sp. JJ-181]
MRRLFISSFTLNIAVMALNIVTGIMMARWLGPYARGEFAAATRWTMLLIGLFAVGLPGAMIYLGKQYRERQRELLGAYLALGLSIGILGLIVGELALPLLLNGASESVLAYARIAMLCLPFAVLTDGLIGALQSRDQFRKVLALRVLSPLGQIAVIGALEAAGRLTVSGLIWYNTVLWGGLTFALTIAWVVRTIRPSLAGFRRQAKDLTSNGFKIFGGSLVAIFGGNLDQLVLSLALSPYSLGLYAVASSVGGLLPSIVFGALGVFLWPKLMDLSTEQRQRKVESIHARLFYGSTAVTAAGAALLPFALPLLYGREYEPAVWMGLLLLAGSPLRIGSAVLINYLNTAGKFHAVTLSEIASLSAGFIVMLTLLPVSGGMSAAIGMLAASAVKWLYAAIVAVRSGLSVASLFKPDAGMLRLSRIRARVRPAAETGTEGRVQ